MDGETGFRELTDVKERMRKTAERMEAKLKGLGSLVLEIAAQTEAE